MHFENCKIAVLTGAGSTDAFGMPGMSGFIKELKKDSVDKIARLANRFRFMHPDYNPVFCQGELDLESILSLINTCLNLRNIEKFQFSFNKFKLNTSQEDRELRNMRMKLEGPPLFGGGLDLPSVSDDIFDDLIQVEKYIKEKIFNIYGDEEKSANGVLLGILVFLDYICKNIGASKPIIFTTNYDLLLEKDLEKDFKNQHDYVDGFRSDGRQEVWDQRVFLEPQDYNRIHIFKIHGSVNWCFDKINKRIIKQIPNYNTNPNYENMIIYPFEKSYRRFSPFGMLLNTFIDCLLKVNHLIILGFSMRDDDINDIIEYCMNENKKLNLYILDPKSKYIRDSLVGKGYFLQVIDRIDTLPAKLTLDDSFNKDVFKMISDSIMSVEKSMEHGK